MDVTHEGIHRTVRSGQLAKASLPTVTMFSRLTETMLGSPSMAQGQISFTVDEKLRFLLDAPTAKATTLRLSALSVMYTLVLLWS